jgi:hypothetical protein
MQKFKEFAAEDAALDKEIDELGEVLDVQARIKKKAQLRKNKAKIKLGKRKMAKRVADKERLQKRARRQARAAVLDKILKGKSKGDLSYGARASFEKRVNQKASLINRLARKLLPTVRKADRAKFGKSGK